jgi:hypothetical protein
MTNMLNKRAHIYESSDPVTVAKAIFRIPHISSPTLRPSEVARKPHLIDAHIGVRKFVADHSARTRVNTTQDNNLALWQQPPQPPGQRAPNAGSCAGESGDFGLRERALCVLCR